jgi:hypothetical protein
MKKPTKAPDATQTIFNVHITPTRSDDSVAKARKALMKKIGHLEALMTRRVNQQVDRMIAAGKLDGNDIDAVGNCTNLLMSTFLRTKAAWFNSFIQFTTSEEHTIKMSDFHADILKLVLKGFVEEGEATKAETYLQSIAHSISNSKSSSHMKGITYIVITTNYLWDDAIKAVIANTRIIQFQTNQRTYDVASESKCRDDYNESKIKLTFLMTEAKFIESLFDTIWAKVGPEFDAELISTVIDTNLG